MNFNVFNSIILAGVIQGLIFGAVVLWSKKYRHKSTSFLATLIITYSLSNFQFYLQDIGVFTYEELYRSIYMPWADLTPPLLYFFVTYYLYPKHKLLSKEYLLLLPFICSTFLGVLYKIFSRIDDKNDALFEFTSFIRNYVAYYTEMISAVISIIVLVILLRKIKEYKVAHSNFRINHVKLELTWLTRTLYFYVFMVFLWISTVLIDLYVEEISFYPVWLGIAFLIYWLGHIGVYKYGVFEERKHIRGKIETKTKRSRENKTKHIIIERLKYFLENDKRFLDSELTLEKTAEALELSRGHLSKIINAELGISFKDYLNNLRVEEAKTYLKDSEFSKYTLAAIGLEAGFNSKSTFNSSFKKITGETPSQYKQRFAN